MIPLSGFQSAELRTNFSADGENEPTGADPPELDSGLVPLLDLSAKTSAIANFRVWAAAVALGSIAVFLGS